jgi:protein phosphatase
VLADGMGGRDFGEVASSLCVSALRNQVKKAFPETLRRRRLADGGPVRDVLVQTFDAWVRDANRVVFEFGALDHRYREMGTTLAMVYQQEDFVVVAHVGDSRVYRIREAAVEQVTEDHSFVNTQVKIGLLTREEAERSQHRNVLTRAIGVRASVKPDVSVHAAVPRDVYLLCSDGLSDLVEPEEMAGAVRKAGADLGAAVDSLVDLANERGGTDNITVVLARVEA